MELKILVSWVRLPLHPPRNTKSPKQLRLGALFSRPVVLGSANKSATAPDGAP